MTDTATIDRALSTLVKDMLAKGFRKPEITFSLNSDAAPYMHMNWRKAGDTFNSYASDCTECFNGATFEECHDQATAWISEQPTVEQRKFREFAEILGKAIEVGKQNGIDVTLVNPLEQAMKTLSKNALIFQPEAA